MKKKVGLRRFLIVFLVVGVFYGIVFSYNYFGLNNSVRAGSDTENRITLEMEYATEDMIETNINEYFKKDSQNVISLTQLDSNNDSQNNLNRQFRVETVNRDSEMTNQQVQIAENIYVVDVKLNDTTPPVIEGKDVTIATGGEFNVDALEIHAYDSVDGDLDYEVSENNVDTATAGEYKVVVNATDWNDLKTQKSFTVTVQDSATQDQVVQGGGSGTSGYTSDYTYSGDQSAAATTQALDRNNLYVRGWKIIATDSRVSDATIQAYMNELANLPAMYNTSHFSTVTIDLSLPYPYLGMAYSDGRLWLQGQGYYSTTVLHEATHAYDYTMGFANDPELVSIFNAEKNNIPAKFSGNMRDDTYEWVANIVVYYYYDPATLKANAPRSYDYVVNKIL